jgi:predicted PurR-regulated permease PerM
MPAEPHSPKNQRLTSFTYFVASTALIISMLYFGRALLIPLALSILLSFILSPLVTILRRWGAGRVLSVITTVMLAFLLLLSIGTMITVELKGLANELPAYRQNIRQKISDIRSASKSESLRKVKAIAQEIVDEFKQDDIAPENLNPDATVVVTEEKKAKPTNGAILDSLVEPLSSAGLVVVLVIFMLLRREDLRDRLLHVAGCDNLVTSTKAIEEASRKVSRYLGRQCILNAIFGIGVSVGLALIGLPYAFLWGFLAGTARFIPYVGPVLGAVAPMLVSVAVFHSWSSTLLVAVLILGWELVNNMILEPVIYGQGIGVSEVALLIMMAFWTWLWGPLGLVMAAPLTVCIVVISKTVPGLGFISMLLDSKPSLSRHHALYQRLIAQNHDEAMEMISDYLKVHTVTEFFETICVPLLEIARRDHKENRLATREQKRIFQLMRDIILEVRGTAAKEAATVPQSEPHALIIGCPVADEADELVLVMLAELLAAERSYMPVLSAGLTEAEKLEEIAAFHPTALCLGYLPTADSQAYLDFCARVHERFPGLPIVAATKADRSAGSTDHSLKTSSFEEAKQQLLTYSATPPEAGQPEQPEIILAAPSVMPRFP